MSRVKPKQTPRRRAVTGRKTRLWPLVRAAGRKGPSALEKLRPVLLPAAGGLGLLALCGGGALLWQNGWLTRTAETVRLGALDASARAGLAVGEVLVTGRAETDRTQLLDALGISRGDPILAFDPAAARGRIESLPWVEVAHVERRLPDTLYVGLTERRPLALWQHNRQLSVIDRDGVVLTRHDVARFGNLPLVVGADAPENAPALLTLLAAEPALDHEIEAAIRVGGRRWDLRLVSGVTVQLPETDPGLAISRLARMQEDGRLLAAELTTIDLRLEDRMVVRAGRAFRPEPDTLAEDRDI